MTKKKQWIGQNICTTICNTAAANGRPNVNVYLPEYGTLDLRIMRKCKFYAQPHASIKNGTLHAKLNTQDRLRDKVAMKNLMSRSEIENPVGDGAAIDHGK